ncbi:hypothetical protein BD779DRAFT_177558 [Infundibulicybe gibba]|nr:hypothetical protein BD779DRAFT_177558 [Infundibulicybe gibba]
MIQHIMMHFEHHFSSYNLNRNIPLRRSHWEVAYYYTPKNRLGTRSLTQFAQGRDHYKTPHALFFLMNFSWAVDITLFSGMATPSTTRLDTTWGFPIFSRGFDDDHMHWLGLAWVPHSRPNPSLSTLPVGAYCKLSSIGLQCVFITYGPWLYHKRSSWIWL